MLRKEQVHISNCSKKLSKIKVLLIDDFLMQSISVEESSFLTDIIDEKQQTGSIIITTQYPVLQWHKKLPDPTVADAICDRLIHKSYTFELEGDSMRKKILKSQKKLTSHNLCLYELIVNFYHCSL